MIQVENLNLPINSPFREQYRLEHQLLEHTINYYTYYLFERQQSFELGLLDYNCQDVRISME